MNPKLKAGVLVSFSPDGVTWTIEPKPQISMEMSGGVILPAGTDGTPKRFVVAGHGGKHYPPGRRMVLFQSYDFESWDASTVSGFNRVPQVSAESHIFFVYHVCGSDDHSIQHVD